MRSAECNLLLYFAKTMKLDKGRAPLASSPTYSEHFINYTNNHAEYLKQNNAFLYLSTNATHTLVKLGFLGISR